MERDVNPYEPPKTNLSAEPDPGASNPLATRGSRFAAAMVDGLILMVVIVPLQILLGVYDGFPDIQPPSVMQQVIGGLAGVAVYTLINGKFLADNGQTIGKKALGIRIVNLDGSKPTLMEIVAKRYAPFTFIGLVPVIGPLLSLVNALLIFGQSHRCGHDLVAGTKVIQA